MTPKIRDGHLARKAILYVRQSSQHQLIRNEESRRLQYAMESRLRTLGWHQIEIIDEDLGKTASGAVDRSGFERMVAEVCLGQVGAVAAREVSRFARNNREWQQLVEVCRMVDTVLIDQEAVYDPRRGNDRLLLGLKGSLNEYELDILRLRSVEARREKARRGELVASVPVGYVRSDDGGISKDPDRRVREALELVFGKFVELGSVRQVLLWFLSHDLQLPARRHDAGSWKTRWRRPTYQMVLGLLKNPTYAGVYAYGRTTIEVDYRDGAPRKRSRSKPVEDWLACIYDHHEGYVDREQYDRIQRMIAQNARCGGELTPGAVREGAALLSGLLRCGHCGRKLTVVYTGRRRDVARYACRRGALDNGERRCISFGGSSVDSAISREILRVVSPAGLEVARRASTELERRQNDVLNSLSLAAEEARYAVDRARRQYDAVDPENRLVAEELERRWNAELEKLDELQRRIDREATRASELRPASIESLEDLPADLEQVWNDPATDVRLKKRILRTLIEEVVVDVAACAGRILLVIHWKGGVHSEISVKRRRRGQNRLRTPANVIAAIELLSRTCTDDVIAGVLNRNGLPTGRGNRWTRERVASVRARRNLPRFSAEQCEEQGWMNLSQAAAHVGLATVSLRRAVERGEVVGEHPLPDGPWVFQREHLDDPRVRQALGRVQKRARRGGVQAPGQLSLFPSTH